MVVMGVRGSRRKESTSEIKDAASLARVRGFQYEQCSPEPIMGQGVGYLEKLIVQVLKTNPLYRPNLNSVKNIP